MEKILSKNITGYLLYTILSSVIPFFTMPILTRYLSPGQYGMISIYSVYVSILTAVIGVSSLTVFIKIYHDDNYNNKIFLSTSIIISLLSALVVCLLIIIFAQKLSDIYSIPVWWFYLAIIVVLFDNIISIKALLYRMTGDVLAFGLFGIGRLILRALLSIYLVVFLDYGENGPVLAGIYSSFIYLILSSYLLHKNNSLSLHPKLSYAKYAANFGIRLTPHVLMGALSSSIDKIIIGIMLTKEELGLYTVGFVIGGLIKSLEGAVYMAYQPWFFKEISDTNCDNKKIVYYSYLIVAGLFVCALLLTFISSNYLIYYTGDNFKGADKIVPWVAFAFVINAMYTMVNQVLLYKDKSGTISLITITTVLLGVLLNYILIKANGLIGAAQALVLIYLIRTVITWLYSNHLYPLGWFTYKSKSHA